MQGHVDLVLLALAAGVVAASLLARRAGVPYPIVLVIAGAVLGFVPGTPDLVLEPDLVLLVFLPPLLFNAAYFASPADLRSDLRSISLLAVGLVLATAEGPRRHQVQGLGQVGERLLDAARRQRDARDHGDVQVGEGVAGDGVALGALGRVVML